MRNRGAKQERAGCFGEKAQRWVKGATGAAGGSASVEMAVDGTQRWKASSCMNSRSPFPCGGGGQ